MKQTSCVRELVDYRELLWMLIWRDIRVRYKHSLLGTAWAILPPLAMMAVFTVVFRRALDIESTALTGQDRVPYPLFALAGVVPWTFFSNALTSAVNALVANRPMLTKIQFPREVFPFAAVGSALVDFFVSVGAMVGLMIWYSATTGWRFQPQVSLAFLPVVLAVQVALTAGLSLLLAMGNLYFRDIGFILRAILPLWLFGTNVVYELHASGSRLQVLLNINPLTPIIDAYRACLFRGQLPDPAAFAYASTVAFLTLAVGWLWFHRLEFEFAEHV